MSYYNSGLKRSIFLKKDVSGRKRAGIIKEIVINNSETYLYGNYVHVECQIK